MLAFLIPLALLSGVVVWVTLPYLSRQRQAARGDAATTTTATGSEQSLERETARVREEMCPQCGIPNNGKNRTCFSCGAQMPSDSFLDVLRGQEWREGLIQELREPLILLGIVIIALFAASWMSTEVKIAVTIATLAILAFRFLKGLSD